MFEIKGKVVSNSLDDPTKKSFINEEKITLNYCDLEHIDRVPKKFLNVKKLHLSHNKIKSLTGIE